MKAQRARVLIREKAQWFAFWTVVAIATVGVFNHHAVLNAMQQLLPAVVNAIGGFTTISLLVLLLALLGGFGVWCFLRGFIDGTGDVMTVPEAERGVITRDKSRTLVQGVALFCLTVFGLTVVIVAYLGWSPAQTGITARDRLTAECQDLYVPVQELVRTTGGKFDSNREAEARGLLRRIEEFQRLHIDHVHQDDAMRLLLAKAAVQYVIKDQPGLAATIKLIEDRKVPLVWVSHVERLKLLLVEISRTDLPQSTGNPARMTLVPADLIDPILRAEKSINKGDPKSALKLLREVISEMERTLAMELEEPRIWWMNAKALAALAASMLPTTDEDYAAAHELAQDVVAKSTPMLSIPMDETVQFSVRRSRLQSLTVLQTLAVREERWQTAAQVSTEVLSLTESIVDSLARIELMQELLTQYGNAEFIQESMGDKSGIERLIIRRKDFLERLIKKGETKLISHLNQADDDLRNHKSQSPDFTNVP